MKIIEIIEKNVVKVRRSLPLRNLLGLFREFHTHPLIPVVDEQDHLVGVVSPENLLDLLRPHHAKLFRHIPFMDIDEDVFDLDAVPSMGDLIIVEDIMAINFVFMNKNDSLEAAYKAMRLHKKERLPVVDEEGKLVGILGIFDIILWMFKKKEIV